MKSNPAVFAILLTILVAPAADLAAAEPGDELTRSGSAKFDARDFAGALADCARALERNPKNADAYALRGMVKAGRASCLLGKYNRKGPHR